MGLKTNKPRGRNGGRPPKLTEEQRLELGAYAYRIRRGAPIPGYQLPHDADDDWPLSSAANAIIDARYKMLDGDYDGKISKDSGNFR